MTEQQLAQVARAIELELDDSDTREKLVDALARSRRTTPLSIVTRMEHRELQRICLDLGLSDSGSTKDLLARLTGKEITENPSAGGRRSGLGAPNIPRHPATSLVKALALNNIGSWEWDVSTNVVVWSFKTY